MATLKSYATSDDLESYWKTLSSAETDRADVLLSIASNLLRMKATAAGVDLDLNSVANAAYAGTLKWVVMEAVKRALQSPIDQQSVESAQITAGPYSQNLKYSNPTGDLFFKKSELSLLGLIGVQTIRSISTIKKDIYTSSEGTLSDTDLIGG